MDSYETNGAGAWGASTWWGASVAVALFAAVAWCLLVAYAARCPLWLRCAFPFMVVGAVVVTVVTWLTIPPLGGGGGVWTLGGSSDGGGEVGDITRDQLVVYHVDGLDLDVGWGLYVGIAMMVLLAIALTVACRAHALDVPTKGEVSP